MFIIHLAYGITATASYANHFDDALHLILYRTKIQ